MIINFKCPNEELERKAKTLIAIGLDMLLVLSMETYGYEYRKNFKEEINSLVKQSLHILEEQYFISPGRKVLPLDAVQEIKYLVKNLESAIDDFARNAKHDSRRARPNTQRPHHTEPA